MSVVQPQNLNIMDLSIFPDIMKSSNNVVVDELLSFAKSLKEYGEMNCYQDVCNLSDSLSGEAAKVKYLLTLT